MLPDKVQLTLHVLIFAGHHDHRILLWQNDGELAKGTIPAEGRALAAPELVAIPLQPIILRL